MRRLMALLVALSSLYAPTYLSGSAWAAFFDDGNDKAMIADLRLRLTQGDGLSELEEAMLTVAARTGQISCEGGMVASNATLISIGGRDAIITTAHAFSDLDTRAVNCDLTSLVYFPNLSFYDPRSGEPSNFEKRVVKTFGEPVNVEATQRSSFPLETDWLIFLLSEQISSDILPDGSIRGFMPLITKDYFQSSGTAHLIGTDIGYYNGLASMYQSCKYVEVREFIQHLCDTRPSVSSSSIFTLTGGEPLLLAIHKGANTEKYDSDKMYPVPEILFDYNSGLSIISIREKRPQIEFD